MSEIHQIVVTILYTNLVSSHFLPLIHEGRRDVTTFSLFFKGSQGFWIQSQCLYGRSQERKPCRSKTESAKNANSLLGVGARPDRSRRELTKGADSDGDCSSQGTHLFLIGLKKWNKLWRKNKGKIKALMRSRSAFNRRPPPSSL